MVMWSEWLSHVASALGCTTTQAGIIMSLFIWIGIAIIVLIVTRGRKAESTIPLLSIPVIVFFTFIGWFPIWTGSLLGLVFSVYLALKFTKLG